MADKRGSALLIVLGFLSFMVVSAVAFSIYMRSERVPSSVFRRTAQTRHLVKAALGRAIAEIDDAIRSDPFPGVTGVNSRKISGSIDFGGQNAANGRFMNEWRARVFMPPNPDKVATGSSQAYDGRLTANDDETVDVLTLEALGYLPPNLINDVRFLARKSFSSKWRMLDYGCGRFAYCAVNVSDYFDINRTGNGRVDGPRTSYRRVNLASIFCNDYNSVNEGTQDVGDFYEFLRTRGGSETTWPFVSMLDYALGVGGGKGPVQSPFYRYIGNGNGSTMYQGANDFAAKQLFVTDSWLPLSQRELMFADSTLDLGDRRAVSQSGQPFPQEAWMRADNRRNYDDIVQGLDSDFGYRIGAGRLPSTCSSMSGVQKKSLLQLDLVSLHDYLDRDDVPTSLALPCCERVPMVTALGFDNFSFNFSLTPSTRTEDKMEGNSKIEIEYTEYKITAGALSSAPRLNTGIVFPFKRAKEINQNFRARAMVRAFITEEGTSGLRVQNDLAGLRPNSDDEWNTSSALTLPAAGGALPPLVFTWVSRTSQSINTKVDIVEQDDVTLNNTVDFDMSDMPGGYENTIVFSKKVEKKTDHDAEGNVTGTSSKTYYCFNATPFAQDGSRMVNSAEWIEDSEFTSKYAAKKFQLQVAAWVLVESGDDVVDLVPATVADDLFYNDMSNPGVQQSYGDSQGRTPIFRFRCPDAQPLNIGAPSPLTVTASTLEPRSYYAVDPRFNWAPEDWVPRSTAASADNWLDWIRSFPDLLGKDGHDSDVFMFVSNQGFLQSMGELAFLPRLTHFANQSQSGSAVPIDLLKEIIDRYNGTELQIDSSWDVIAGRDLVWRTYHPYASAGDQSDYLLNFRNFKRADSYAPAFRDIGDKGVRVNPYTDNEQIRMAAFAYTPYDWWAAAGTNTQWQSFNSADNPSAREGWFGDDDLASSRKFTFNGQSSEAKISTEQITKVGNYICDAIRAAPDRPWQEVYDSLDWYGDGINPANENSFCNFLSTQVDGPLHGVDRKFLYAFWRGALANRQQLFLVFLRAESMALGGSGEGQIPPQQGGRAVALVWRDPEPPIDANGVPYSQDGNTPVSSWVPHRTRVLFFHQFD